MLISTYNQKFNVFKEWCHTNHCSSYSTRAFFINFFKCQVFWCLERSCCSVYSLAGTPSCFSACAQVQEGTWERVKKQQGVQASISIPHDKHRKLHFLGVKILLLFYRYTVQNLNFWKNHLFLPDLYLKKRRKTHKQQNNPWK